VKYEKNKFGTGKVYFILQIKSTKIFLKKTSEEV